METMKELYMEGELSSRVFNAVKRNIRKYFIEMVPDRFAAMRISDDLSDHITVKALFEMFGEDRIRNFKGLGKLGFEHLKGLL